MQSGFECFEIAMLIKEVYSSTMNIVSKNLKDSGLTHQQIMVIKLVAHKKEITISQLCEEMSLAKGTVSGIVQRLEDADYVKKVKSENDKRNTYVVFSEKGLEFAKEFRYKINESFDEVFKNFTKEEMDEAKQGLRKLRDKIKENE
ncbi:MarR family winged helix-turn-helix transcriptional regulator [Clostridium gasigenes]|uniref:DNA-binding transcriptional regulator, MarR family n=1 Tax=Clostridium gasigenes TaxID=94869 RepID=A0A1H0LKF6_9CLOT|nr:MarR family transcriptional regulator [Clostridium gasigenes]MBB6622469.1 MarR family transcriptional regulator [Clostridium gasigenes]MBB6713969.1 MarR family transcriptional regulator [Clostridium gasigenes]MBU3087240.1 MarR family transcriptional regulator [Clostridium gasigenes]MBU3103515.1 MarR family transcriptional regulator [Clostridium gasigenes]MBU3109020.1 MarR family transcriptional regulator [Clostridium gasigenes]